MFLRMEASPHILIVDDHREIRELVGRALTREGFRVTAVGDGKAMQRALADAHIDLVLLDLMLPGEDGLSLCRRVRADSDIPIIMLTAKGEEVDRVIGLEMGADDYLTKPFGSRELIARIRAVLRRSHHPPAASDPPPELRRYRFDRWVLNTENRELVREDGVTVPLSTGEYELLLALVERPQRVLSRDQLLDLARGRAAAAFDRSIDTQVSRLRKKLERDPAEPHIIKTIWGGGYMFAAAVSRDMTRWLPRTLFGQMLLILLAGLLVSHLVGTLIYASDRAQAVRAIGGYAATQRIANLTQSDRRRATGMAQPHRRGSKRPNTAGDFVARAAGVHGCDHRHRIPDDPALPCRAIARRAGGQVARARFLPRRRVQWLRPIT